MPDTPPPVVVEPPLTAGTLSTSYEYSHVSNTVFEYSIDEQWSLDEDAFRDITDIDVTDVPIGVRNVSYNATVEVSVLGDRIEIIIKEGLKRVVVYEIRDGVLYAVEGRDVELGYEPVVMWPLPDPQEISEHPDTRDRLLDYVTNIVEGVAGWAPTARDRLAYLIMNEITGDSVHAREYASFVATTANDDAADV